MQRYNDVEGYGPFKATGEPEEDHKTNSPAVPSRSKVQV